MARYLEDVESFKKYNRNIRVRVLIDWFNFEEDIESMDELEDYMVVIEDSIDAVDINRDLEGFEGTSVRDTSTITLLDPERDYSPKNLDSTFTIDEYNFIEPNKLTLIQVKGENTDWLTYHQGILTEITPDRMSGEVTFTIDDMLSILQNKTCSDSLLIENNGDRILTSTVVLEWLDEVNLIEVDEDSVRNNLTRKIIYNFKGMTYFEAIQQILELNNSFMFTRNGLFTIESKMNLDDKDIVETFADKGTEENQENIFEINEVMSRDDLFNTVRIESSPYRHQKTPEKVWLGGDEEVTVNEIYQGSDFDDRTLQLMETELDGNDFQDIPTRNVPIVPNTLTLTFADEHYRDGIELDVNYETGEVTIKSEYDVPADELEVEANYDYYFSRILAGRTREFLAHLEYPCIDITDIGKYMVAYDFETGETYFTGDTERRTFSSISSKSSGNVTFTRSVSVPEGSVKGSLNFGARIYSSDKYFGLAGRKAADWSATIDLKYDGETVDTIYNGSGSSNDDIGFTSSIDNLDNVSEVTIEINANIEGSRGNSDGGYTFKMPHPYGWADGTYIDFHTRDEQSGEIDEFIVDSELRDDGETVWVKIENTSNKEIVVYSDMLGENDELLVIEGEPIKQVDNFNEVIENKSSIDYFKVDEELSIQNDLFSNKSNIHNLASFLLYQFSTPTSVLNIDTVGYSHLELLDKVKVEEEKRDIDSVYYISSIVDTISNGVWEQSITLTEFKEGWEPEYDFITGPDFPSQRDRDKIREPQPVTNINAYVQEVMTSDDGTFNARLFAEWNNPDTVFHSRVEVYIKRNNEEWKYLGDTSQDNFEENLVPADTYELALISVNQGGERNSFNTSPTISLDVIQKDAPAPLEFIPEKMEWKDDYLKLAWNPHPDKDFEEYEIRTDLNFGVES